MKHSIFGEVVMVPVSSIKELPRNKTIHPDFDPAGRDAWLVENLDRHGILEPLLLKPDRTLHGGHRRFNWARLRKIELVPCIVVKAGDDNAVYESTQLHRSMTVYAKCVLYREKLTDLIKRGDSARERNLKMRHGSPAPSHGPGGGGLQADDSVLNQEWIKCEEVLGVSRRNLITGVKLLDKIDAMQSSGKPDEIDRANRILSIFRNRGLRPAADLLGEKIKLASDSEPDVRDWQADDDEPEAPKKKRSPAGTVKFAKRDDVDAVPGLPWVDEVLKSLARIESLTKQHKAYSPVVKASLNAIERDVTGATVKRAA